jgi:hypothetical protein
MAKIVPQNGSGPLLWVDVHVLTILYDVLFAFGLSAKLMPKALELLFSPILQNHVAPTENQTQVALDQSRLHCTIQVPLVPGNAVSFLFLSFLLQIWANWLWEQENQTTTKIWFRPLPTTKQFFAVAATQLEIKGEEGKQLQVPFCSLFATTTVGSIAHTASGTIQKECMEGEKKWKRDMSFTTRRLQGWQNLLFRIKFLLLRLNLDWE